MKNNLVRLRQEAMDFIHDNISNLDIREKQLLFVNCSMLYDKSFVDLITSEDKETVAFHSEILRYGYPVFISILYDAEYEHLVGIPLPAMDQDRILFCRSLLYAFKTVGWMDYLLEGERLGNFKVSCLFNRCRIRFAKKYHWNEFLEQEYFDIYSKVIAHVQSEAYAELEKIRPAVIEKMKDHVFVFLDDFIGYGGDFETEFYFHALAELDLQQETEWDMFDGDSSFRGLPYKIFIDTVTDFSGYAIKHVEYCSILRASNPHLFAENLMYNATEHQKMIKLITENRSITTEEAEAVFRNISLRFDNSCLYASSYLPPAPFIKVSSNLYLHSVAGSLWHPFAFLLENLHCNCPKEWDRNANLREKLFKGQLYDIFAGYTCIQHNIQITNGKQFVTDIDAAIVDKHSGEIALFQLKWQDLTEFSSKSLASKSKNYNTTTTEWVDQVKTWISSCSEKELASKLGVKQKHIDKNKIYLFVLGRRHGNYSQDKYTDDGCAWTQWYQLLACLTQLKKDQLTISALHQLIRSSSPYKKRIIERKVKYKIGKYTIVYGGY